MLLCVLMPRTYRMLPVKACYIAALLIMAPNESMTGCRHFSDWEVGRTLLCQLVVRMGGDMQAIRRALINSVEKRRLALKMSGYLYFNRLHLHSDYDVPIGKRRDLYPKRFGSTLINGGWQNNTERFALATRRSPSISRSG